MLKSRKTYFIKKHNLQNKILTYFAVSKTISIGWKVKIKELMDKLQSERWLLCTCRHVDMYIIENEYVLRIF